MKQVEGNFLNQPYLIVVSVVIIYVLAWICMPLYPDEVAFRLNGARFFFDDGLIYGIYPTCTSNLKTTALIFYPVAAFYAYIGSFSEWAGIRLIPSISLFLSILVSLIIAKNNRFGWSSGIFLIGFMGVSGSGLVLSRPEWVLLLHAIFCLISYYFLNTQKCSELISSLVISSLIFIALLSFYVHIQGIIFFPLTILPLALYLLRRDISLYAQLLTSLAIFVVFIGLSVSIARHGFHCPEVPVLKQFISSMTITGIYNEKGFLQSIAFLSDKLWRYMDQFQFKGTYDINYLPSAIPLNEYGQYAVKVLNVFIVFLLTANLYCSIAITCHAGISIIKKLFISANELPIKERLNASAPYVFIFFTLAPVLSLFIYDAATNFYRCFYLNLIMVIANGIVLSFSVGKLKWILNRVGIVSLLTCIFSIILVLGIIRPKIILGQVGPSIAIDTDWSGVQADVEKLKESCAITNEMPKILMDDMTYDALKNHPHLMPITYFSLVAILSSQKNPNDLPLFYKTFFDDIAPNAAVMRCDYFFAIGVKPVHRKGALCCTKF